jgi:hypothetical protein
LKQGILNPLHKNYQDNKESFEFFKKIKSLQDLIDLEKSSDPLFCKLEILLQKGVFSYTPLNYCSTQYLIENSVGNNSIVLGMTSGGRTVNERPEEYLIEYGADVAISSAYGTILLDAQLSVGRASIYCKTSNQTNVLTLGEFMQKYYDKIKLNKNSKI